MPDKTNPSTAGESEFENVLAKILQAEEAGKKVDLSRVVRMYPKLERQLREYFRNRDGFDRLAPGIKPPASRPDVAPGSQVAGYELLGELGRGGMGVVYKARQVKLKRVVALKMILAGGHTSEDDRARFLTEAEAVARLHHPGIVQIYEVNEHNGLPYFSMEYVEGGSLEKDLAGAPMPPKAAARLVEQLAQAIQTAHEHKVIHRDLKPANVLLSADGKPKITDFGLAKRLDVTGKTRTGAVMGTPSYMAPEQASGKSKAIGPPADIYALGAILYQCLTGRPPFQAANPLDILLQVVADQPVPPRRLNPTVDRDLNTITLKCLEKEPARRFGSAGELANELRRYLEGRPIRTRPIVPAGRLWRWCRRNPLIASLSAAAVVLLTLVGALVWAYSSAGQQVGDLTRGVKEKQKHLKEDEGKVNDLAGEVKKKQEPLKEDEGKVNDLAAQGKEKQEHLNTPAYLNDMGSAQKYLDGGEPIKAREVLAQWRPAEGKTDQRGWEWHFLEARCRATGFFKRGHSGQVYAVAWNPSAPQLASADRQGFVKVWDVDDGKEAFSFRAQADGVLALAWSPDGKRLATAGQKSVQIWDAATRKPLRTLQTVPNINLPLGFPTKVGEKPLDRHVYIGSWTMSLLWSPSGQKLALADADGKIQIWDPGTDKPPFVWKVDPEGVDSAAWNADGSRLASIGGEGLVKVWDAVAGKEVHRVPTRTSRDFKPRPSYALTWTEGGKRLLVVANDGEVCVLDPAAAKPVSTFKLVQRDPLAFGVGRLGTRGERFIWSPDGKLIASIERVSVVRIWDAATGKEGASFTSPGAVGAVLMAECAPAWDPSSGRRLALGIGDGTVQAWRVDVRRQPVRRLKGTIGLAWPIGLAWSADSRHIIATPNPGVVLQPSKPGAAGQKPQPQIQVCDAVTGEAARTLDAKVRADVLAESPNGQWLATATRDGLIQLWPASGGKQPATLEEPPKGGPPAGGFPKHPVSPSRCLLSWSSDSKRLACATPLQTTIRLWDPSRTNKPVRTLKGPEEPPRSLAWSPDGERLASAHDDGTFKVWDASSGKQITTLRYFVNKERGRGMAKPLASSALSWCRDGKRLAVAGEDEAITIWDVDAAKELATLLGDPSSAVAWSPDGKRLASASADGKVLLWAEGVAGWKKVLVLSPPLPGPFGPALQDRPGLGGMLAWSPDGKQLAFFGGGGSVLIWDATREDDKPGLPVSVAPKDKPGLPVNGVPADESGIVAALQKVGAGIRRDEKQPGKPVWWVDLTNRTKVTDADVKGLKNLKRLNMLNLGVTQVTDECLTELKDLKSLETLNIPFTRVTDAGLEHLKDLQGLQILNLAMTRVTDTGLKHLKGLKSLRLLDLTGTGVTDAGVKHLKELKSLQWLLLPRTKVTDAGLNDLKQALPKCRIDR
jgi:WD40 repeat protein/serine/threonine protein kinase